MTVVIKLNYVVFSGKKAMADDGFADGEFLGFKIPPLIRYLPLLRDFKVKAFAIRHSQFVIYLINAVYLEYVLFCFSIFSKISFSFRFNQS